MEYSESQIDYLIELIYKGQIDPLNLPKGLYLSIGKHLENGIYQGYGKSIKEFEFGSVDYAMLGELRENTYIFSGAKTFQQTRELTSLITKDGDVLPFSEFKKLALDKFELYNKTYLETEYNFAVGQARNASHWVDFERNKEALPLLKYQTVEDANVRDEHRKLDNIVKPVGDPFWDTYAPKNGWGCRCILIAVEDGEITPTNKKDLPEIPKLFDYNVGKDKEIFKKEHPYFDIPDQYKKFAKRNFDLDIPGI